jgi:hypothetical protein
MVGVGADALVIAAPHRRFAGSVSTYTVIRALNKTLLASNSAACQTAISEVFVPATQSGDQSLTFLQPVAHVVAPSSFPNTDNPVYLVSTRPGGGQDYKVLRLRNITSGASRGSLQWLSVQSQEYLLPPPAKQAGTETTLETNDARTLQAAGLGDAIWFVLTSRCELGGGGAESCVRVVRVVVGQFVDSPTATVSREATVGLGPDAFLMMPGIAVTQAERVVIPVLASSTTSHLSFGWTATSLANPTFSPVQLLSTGTCARVAAPPAPGTIRRTGDYLGAQVDPDSLGSVWVAGESAAVEPPGNPFCTWRTEVRQIF